MGYDIHPFIELDEHRPPSRRLWTSNLARLYGARDQLLFGLLTNGGVGAQSAKGFAPQARGLPERTSDVIRDDLLYTLEEGSTSRCHRCTLADAVEWTQLGYSQWVLDAWRMPLQFYDPVLHGALAEDGRPPPPGDRLHWEVTGPSYGRFSWLTTGELAALLDVYGEVGARIWDGRESQPFEGLDGEPLPLVLRTEPGKVYRPRPEVYAWLAALRALEQLEEVEQVRLVFWFSN